MIRTQVQLTEAQAHVLKELAHQEKVSVAELTRRALDYWLQNRHAMPDAEAETPCAGSCRTISLGLAQMSLSGTTATWQRPTAHDASSWTLRRFMR